MRMYKLVKNAKRWLEANNCIFQYALILGLSLVFAPMIYAMAGVLGLIGMYGYGAFVLWLFNHLGM